MHDSCQHSVDHPLLTYCISYNSETCHIPLHDNKQTFAIIVSVLVDVDDLHNVITHRRSIVKVHFTTCLWHILQSLHTQLAQVRSNHMHENMAKDRSIIILKWAVQIFIYLKIMLRITLAITITSREVLTYEIIRCSGVAYDLLA